MYDNILQIKNITSLSICDAEMILHNEERNQSQQLSSRNFEDRNCNLLIVNAAIMTVISKGFRYRELLYHLLSTLAVVQSMLMKLTLKELSILTSAALGFDLGNILVNH